MNSNTGISLLLPLLSRTPLLPLTLPVLGVALQQHLAGTLLALPAGGMVRNKPSGSTLEFRAVAL